MCGLSHQCVHDAKLTQDTDLFLAFMLAVFDKRFRYARVKCEFRPPIHWQKFWIHYYFLQLILLCFALVYLSFLLFVFSFISSLPRLASNYEAFCEGWYIIFLRACTWRCPIYLLKDLFYYVICCAMLAGIILSYPLIIYQL